mmetsp:Transcript_34647/g.103487  ORF Transcript_34647/g.103487 Transcript_34647/m.103487 type:complete len:225 (-) Transcript_34647:435-1109(-)
MAKRFDVGNFGTACEAAMTLAGDPPGARQAAATSCLGEAVSTYGAEEMLRALEASVPPDSSPGDSVVYQSQTLTVLYVMLMPRIRTAAHDHTIFACISQLQGEERNVFYERDESRGLRETGELVCRMGDEVFELPASVIHHVENPSETVVGKAIHLYGGDFRGVMPDRAVWTRSRDGTFEEKTFSLKIILKESLVAMKRDGNKAGLDSFVRWKPQLKSMVDALD